MICSDRVRLLLVSGSLVKGDRAEASREGAPRTCRLRHPQTPGHLDPLLLPQVVVRVGQDEGLAPGPGRILEPQDVPAGRDVVDGDIFHEVFPLRGEKGLEGDEVEVAVGADEELLSALEMRQEGLQDQAEEGPEVLLEGSFVGGALAADRFLDDLW